MTLVEGELSHSDIKNAFKQVLNIVEPEHPYMNDPYPIAESDIAYTHKKYSSSCYASCGPRHLFNRVSFSADKRYFNNCELERVLAIYAHELTHITVGTHTSVQGGSHPDRFWRKVGFNAHILLDNWTKIETIFGNMSKEKFIGYIISEEINSHNIDRRYTDKLSQRHEMAKWFKNTLC